MAVLQIKQTKSSIDRCEKQKVTLRSLGLRKLNQTVEKEATPQVLGMIKVVQHLVEVKEL